MIEISKKVRSQSLNFTSKPKGYLLQTTKLWEKLIVLNRRKRKATKPNAYLFLYVTEYFDKKCKLNVSLCINKLIRF